MNSILIICTAGLLSFSVPTFCLKKENATAQYHKANFDCLPHTSRIPSMCSGLYQEVLPFGQKEVYTTRICEKLSTFLYCIKKDSTNPPSEAKEIVCKEIRSAKVSDIIHELKVLCELQGLSPQEIEQEIALFFKTIDVIDPELKSKRQKEQEYEEQKQKLREVGYQATDLAVQALDKAEELKGKTVVKAKELKQWLDGK